MRQEGRRCGGSNSYGPPGRGRLAAGRTQRGEFPGPRVAAQERPAAGRGRSGTHDAMRVLVVEDEEFLADMIVSGLRRAALTVDIAHSSRGALDRMRRDAYDVLVLDQDLPGLHGDEVFRYVVEQALPTRVLLLTASGPAPGTAPGTGGHQEPDADDRLTKPFAFDVLRDRVLALGHRARSGRPPVIERAGVLLDTGRRLAVRDGRPLALSRKEFGALEVLLRAQGEVVSDDELIEEVWEEQPRHRTNAVRVTLGTLRAKLGDPPVIEAVPGAGYRMGAGTRPGDGPAAGDEPSASGEPTAGARG